MKAGLGQANQSSQCGSAGWDGALGVGVSQRPQAGETLGWKPSGAFLPTGSPGTLGLRLALRPPTQRLTGGSSGLRFCGQGGWKPNQDASTAPAAPAPQGRLDAPAAPAQSTRWSLSGPSLCHQPPGQPLRLGQGVHGATVCWQLGPGLLCCAEGAAAQRGPGPASPRLTGLDCLWP